jgi:outer membrane protein OmpA-like peptidoglycan-associated protein
LKKGGSLDSQTLKKNKQKQYLPEEIYFYPKSKELDPAYLENLQSMVLFLQENPTKKILIKGYAKDGGSEIDDINLSSDRAETIQKFFLIHGIASKRITFYGLGRTRTEGKLIENKRAIRYHQKVTLEIQD